ncbi:DUF3261 domain-containing protein [Thalassospira lucentensis]|uniref:DUF3261 domain-containing protein n=1 Tax=Thalassospira lucentensis TaxID=168935 RepID=UPI003AA9BB2F
MNYADLSLAVPDLFAPSKTHTVVIDKDISITLPENPWDAENGVTATQQVTARWANPAGDQDSATFLAQISAKTGTVKIAVIDDLGRRAITIDWTTDALQITTADWVPDALNPERLLADIVMTYWPTDVVGDAIEDSMLVEETMGQRTIRINKNGRVFAVIDKPIRDPWQGVATVRNQKLGYVLSIRSQRVGP